MATAQKILVAEDEKPMAKALQLKLTNQGFDVTTVFNGEEAIEALEKENYDLMILDLMMPKLDGFGVLTQVKEKGIKTKIIVASNLSQEEDANRAKEMGAVDFFVKSNTPITDIVDHIKGALK